MKKIIIVLFIFVVLIVSYKEKNNILIPKDAIRFRVIANSDSFEDQNLKLEIKNKVERELYKVIGNAESIKEARESVENNLDTVDKILKKYGINYEINYGNNYFPKKEYKGITYEEGMYESLVITLGSGLGKNWWCVLFPPLCLLDENNNLEDNEYEFYATKLINRFKN